MSIQEAERAWVECPPGTTKQFELFHLRSCMEDSIRQPIVIFLLALSILEFVVIIALLIYRRPIVISRLGDKILLICFCITCIRVVQVILMYIKLFGPVYLILHAIPSGMAFAMASMVMYTWCNAYRSMLLTDSSHVINIVRKVLLVTGSSMMLFLIIVSGVVWALDDFPLRNNILLGTCGYIIASCLIYLCLQIYVTKTFLRAIAENGITNNKKLEKVTNKIKNYTKFVVQVCISTCLSSAAIIFWVLYTNYYANYFFIFLIFGFFMSEHFSVAMFVWGTSNNRIEKVDSSQSGSSRTNGMNSDNVISELSIVEAKSTEKTDQEGGQQVDV